VIQKTELCALCVTSLVKFLSWLTINLVILTSVLLNNIFKRPKLNKYALVAFVKISKTLLLASNPIGHLHEVIFQLQMCYVSKLF
jgi:hypothetical protein